jgi:hypothetical protein
MFYLFFIAIVFGFVIGFIACALSVAGNRHDEI